MTLIKFGITPETSIYIKNDTVIIDGIVTGLITAKETSISVVTMAGEETLFNGASITFGTKNYKE